MHYTGACFHESAPFWCKPVQLRIGKTLLIKNLMPRLVWHAFCIYKVLLLALTAGIFIYCTGGKFHDTC